MPDAVRVVSESFLDPSLGSNALADDGCLHEASASIADDASRFSAPAVTRPAAVARLIPAETTLASKYDLAQDRIYVSGAQAVVRVLLTQRELDRRAGHRTAGFVSGYRGSPLGRVDANLHAAKAQLAGADVTFEPGLNEDLAATAVWGAQQAEMRGEGRYDGVFCAWYGKGPGVDRSADVLRHANLAGTSALGGVIALMGDDHTAESSSTAHQSDFIFADMMMPILAPSNVQEILDYGVMGLAMSRYTGTWTGIKCVKDTVESTASIEAGLGRFHHTLPRGAALPPGGLSIRPRDSVVEQDARLTVHKLAAVGAFLRANGLNRIVLAGGARARLGVVASGKSYADVRQALDALGLDEVACTALGLRLYKLACPWPVEASGLRAFAAGLETIMVVEEKRALIEQQVRQHLYDAPRRPVCVGKGDETGRPLFPPHGALDSHDIAIAIGQRLLRHAPEGELADRLATRLRQLERLRGRTAGLLDAATRGPTFCAGCPHSASTVVPAGARAYAGIGCHYMVQTMDRATDGYTQMGGEGANWIGEAPFSRRGHVFQNLGDGTYNHSGTLAIRWAVAARTNITYKILFNDAVAMTGGQTVEGQLTVERIAAQCAAEGVAAIAVVSDEPRKYPTSLRWPAGTTIEGRDRLDAVQARLAAVPGVTILIYDQTCAAEKRRRRKKGILPDPDVRVFINEAVCEGCGDCGKTSNCVAVQPVETEFGRKRTIDQSACNKDLSCVSGFCPAIVTLSGAAPRKAAPAVADGLPALPPRAAPTPLGTKPTAILIAGVGGTGVVTVAAILGMAAHLEGHGCGIMDMAGLAQKGGAVFSHVKLAARPRDIGALRIAAAEADLVLGCDLVASVNRTVLAAVRKDETAVVVNTAALFPGAFARDPDYDLPTAKLAKVLREAAGVRARFLDATRCASTLMGTALAANMFTLGYAWQLGLVPLEEASILRAIALNGEAVAMNQDAFAWGRRAAAFPAETTAAIDAARPPVPAPATSLDEIVKHREAALTAYQDGAYAERYRALVEEARAAEAYHVPGRAGLAEAVAKGFFKLLAVKDVYEVARLYTDGRFARQVAEAFEGEVAITYHMAPTVPAAAFWRRGGRAPARKRAFGPWLGRLLPLLAAGRRLRGTRLDVFGWSAERRLERRLAMEYEALMRSLLDGLSIDNHATAIALAALPETIRGFGHVREANRVAAKAEEARLLARWVATPRTVLLAAE